MTAPRQVVVMAAVLLLAAVLQGRLAHSMAIGRAQPDFVLVALSCGAILTGGASGIGLGFWAGLLTAALVAVTPGSFLVSRTVSGALAGWLQGSVIPGSLLVPPLVSLTATLTAEVIYVLMAPTHHLRDWAVAVGGEAAYNMGLSFAAYALLRRLGMGHTPDDPFADYS